MYNLVTRAKVKGIAMFTRKRIYKCNEMITVQLIVDLEIRMDKWSKKVAVVTGASSGIGSTIASKLVEHGVIVIGLARRVDRIQTLAKSLESETGTLVAMQCDVTNEKDVKSVFQTIDQHYGPISILINNAGVARNANLMEGPLEKLREVVETNLMGVVTCTICALESMKQVASPGEKPFGHIVNINSVLGHFIPQLPFLNIYPATKFGITAYTEILRQELRNAATNIRVTSLSPGLVQTEILDASNITIDDLKKVMLENPPILQSKDVADALIYILSTPSHVQIHELIMRPMGEIY